MSTAMNRRFLLCMHALGIAPHSFAWGASEAKEAAWEYLNATHIVCSVLRGRWVVMSSLEHRDRLVKI